MNSTGQLNMKRLINTGALNLGIDLKPGEYAFQVVVTDTKAKENTGSPLSG